MLQGAHDHSDQAGRRAGSLADDRDNRLDFSGGGVVLDGFDRPVCTTAGALRPAGVNRRNLVRDIRARP